MYCTASIYGNTHTQLAFKSQSKMTTENATTKMDMRSGQKVFVHLEFENV